MENCRVTNEKIFFEEQNVDIKLVNYNDLSRMYYTTIITQTQ